ncbi:MAG: PAS domain-containing protein [Balneolaceae bacterium]|nr:PAS domain-containing protein [Balneolaceae bacterium]MCH8548222.1 PAS domain-containing protein [Balneolaceae bacterium]
MQAATKDIPDVKHKIKDFEIPEPINMESPFTYDELFFSVTDPKSTITYANDVFVRISKYEPQEVIGQLHKLIRHPEMPRSVFKIFWDLLKSNRPVAAYVKNMAKDGTFYWVMALAFPCDGGYLSIRLKPGSDLFRKVENIYRDTLAFEKEQEKLTDKKKALHASEEFLIEKLNEEGFSDYHQFMWSALQTEMTFREDQLKTIGDSVQSECSNKDLTELKELLTSVVASLDSLKEIHETLMEHSGYLISLARSIMLLSLNAQVGSSKLTQNDLSLSVVAEKMGEQSFDGEEKLREMQNNVHGLSELIGEISFDTISAKLQVEMTINFLEELAGGSKNNDHALITSDDSIRILYSSFMPGIQNVIDHIGELPVYLRKLMSGVKAVERFLLVLKFIHITGKVEVARMDEEANSFSTTFQELIREVNAAEKRLNILSNLIETHQSTGKQYLRFRDRLNRAGHQIRNSTDSAAVEEKFES